MRFFSRRRGKKPKSHPKILQNYKKRTKNQSAVPQISRKTQKACLRNEPMDYRLARKSPKSRKRPPTTFHKPEQNATNSLGCFLDKAPRTSQTIRQSSIDPSGSPTRDKGKNKGKKDGQGKGNNQENTTNRTGTHMTGETGRNGGSKKRRKTTDL